MDNGEHLTKVEIWNLVMQATIAAGTIAVALLAVFGTVIRRWFIRPKLEITIGKKAPFTEICQKEIASSPTGISKFTEIRIRVSNKGRNSAAICKVITDCRYEQRPDSGGIYKSDTFLPRHFYWSNGKETIDILPGIPNYLTIAKIDLSEGQATSDSASSGTLPVYALYMGVERDRGSYQMLGRGKHVFPITLYANNIAQPIKKFIEIFWNGNTPGDIEPANFDIKIITEEQFKNNVGDSNDSAS